jgi:PKD repeat protein
MKVGLIGEIILIKHTAHTESGQCFSGKSYICKKKTDTMRKHTSNYQQLSILIFLVFILQSCNRKPTAAFSYQPADNPEAGETISFINESIDATDYQWDFGNGKTSEEDSTGTIFDQKGSYTVTLLVFNEAGSDSISEIIQINDPTIMGFFVFEPDSVTPLADCNTWVYDNEEDWNEMTEPQFGKFTDEEGFAEFKNLESIPYYILMFKETEEGLYITGGYTEALELNTGNYYAVVSEFIPTDELQAGTGDNKVLKAGRLNYNLNRRFNSI